MPSLQAITNSQLSRLIGTPDAPVLFDVPIEDEYADDPHLIPTTAYRHPFNGIETLAPKLADRKVVVVCQKGLRLSQGAVAILCALGIFCEYLDGCAAAWRKAALSLIPAARIPVCNPSGRTVWLTRQRSKTDRVACPRLIRRFVDPDAMLLFVAPSEVPAVAEKFDATRSDKPDVFWSHLGKTCTFDTMIEESALTTDPLLRLAAIVRGADTDRHDLAPQAAGLMAASLGLSRISRDDVQQLEAGMAIYDAFYRWALDATDEGHDWPAASGGA